MLKRLTIIALIFQVMACTPAELKDAMNTVLDTSGGALTAGEIGSGLKEALNVGITKGANRLSQTDGYFKSAYKILLPEEARQITDKLQNIPGFSAVEDEILKRINRGAEDAAKKAAPIFADAIRKMTFQDATNILMGEGDAATRYLETATYDQLYQTFSPVIIESLDKFKAREYWSDAVTAYNKIPFINKANPSLDEYVTTKALEGLFIMVEKEERNIRKNVSARTSDLLRRVFAKQDR
jgi:hypothetical protein